MSAAPGSGSPGDRPAGADAVSPLADVDPAHRRPDGVHDATVEAVGRASEALEWVERARGRLYDFHQMMGHADLQLGEAVDMLERAGHPELAQRLRSRVVGRNVVPGRWTFQLVEEFEDTYWTVVRDTVGRIEDELLDGRRHVHEAEMKARRRADGPTDDV